MPAGAYVLGGGAVVERFACGAGPLGWRYTATRTRPGAAREAGRLDVVLDGAGRVVRAEVAAGGWLLRGGSVGPDLLWRRGDDERSARADGFTGTSPVWAVAAARRATAGPVRLPLVLLGDEALATRRVARSWAPGPGAGPGLTTYEVADLETGLRSEVHLRGDLVLLTGDAELVELEQA